MRYGTVTLEQYSTGEWHTNIGRPDDVDRIEAKEYKPHFAWFFHYPEIMSGEEALDMLIDFNIDIRVNQVKDINKAVDEISELRRTINKAKDK